MIFKGSRDQIHPGYLGLYPFSQQCVGKDAALSLDVKLPADLSTSALLSQSVHLETREKTTKTDQNNF